MSRMTTRKPTPTSARKPSPSPCRRRRRDATDDHGKWPEETRDVSLPGTLLPTGALRPQAFAAQGTFAATAGGSVVCLCGGCAVECHVDGAQELTCTARSRPLQCCALSPCGRYLAAGEAAGGRGTQLLVFDRKKNALPTALSGHHGVRLLAWGPRSSYLVSISDDGSQVDQQLILWSWPEAERLATSSVRAVTELAFARDGLAFATVGALAPRRWSFSQPEGPPRDRHVTLVGRAMPVDLLRLARGIDGGDLRGPDDAFAFLAWGSGSALHLLTRRGLLARMVNEQLSGWIELGQRVTAMVWASRLGKDSAPAGLLFCALAEGGVAVRDAQSLESIATLSLSMSCPPPEVAGLSVAPDWDALWVVFADRSLVRWRRLQGIPDWSIQAPVLGLRDARCVPESCLPQVVTHTERRLQLWASSPNGLRLQAQTEPQGQAELTALACSPWIVACGRRGGEVSLLSLPDLLPLEPLPARHSGEVLALCFGPWRPPSDAPLLLASTSSDRSVLLFRIDVRRGAVGTEASVVTLLLSLPGHPSAVHGVALLGVSPLRAQLAVCTTDKIMVLRDLELGPGGAKVRRSLKRLARGTRWVGVCAHPARGTLFAACLDGRLLQLDTNGRTQQHVVVSNPEVEFLAPLSLCEEGRLLAVSYVTAAAGPAPSGVLLADAGVLRPLALLGGHAGVPSGLTFLPRAAVLVCWQDGAMLTWEATHLATTEVRRDDRAARSPQTVGPRRLRSSGAEGLRGPEGILARLLASSPKPPRWASGQAQVSEKDDDIAGSRPGDPLGRWARGSKVGAQVRSASELRSPLVAKDELLSSHASSCASCACETVAMPIVGLRGSAVVARRCSSERPAQACYEVAARVALASDLPVRDGRSVRTSAWTAEVGGRTSTSLKDHLPVRDGRPAQTSAWTSEVGSRTSISTSLKELRGLTGACVRSSSDRPSSVPDARTIVRSASFDSTLCLPPKPAFPPPGVEQLCPSLLAPESPPATLLSLATPCRERHRDRDCDHERSEHVAVLAAQLRSREAKPVLEELARALLAGLANKATRSAGPGSHVAES